MYEEQKNLFTNILEAAQSIITRNVFKYSCEQQHHLSKKTLISSCSSYSNFVKISLYFRRKMLSYEMRCKLACRWLCRHTKIVCMQKSKRRFIFKHIDSKQHNFLNIISYMFIWSLKIYATKVHKLTQKCVTEIIFLWQNFWCFLFFLIFLSFFKSIFKMLRLFPTLV